MERREDIENATEVLTECTEQEYDDDVQKELYEEYLEMDDGQAESLASVEQAAAVSEEFEAMSDDELEEIYEKTLSVSEAERTENENEILEQNKERYLKIKFFRQFEDAQKWFETEYPEKDFMDIVGSSEFLDFAAGTRLPVRELVRRYVKMTDKYIEVDSTSLTPVISPGSVKTSGATVGKDYFSPAEVDKMSKEEIGKNLSIIKKSMKKWK